MKVHTEIVNGICPECDEYTMLVGITRRFYRCMSCGTDLEQFVNGKITYMPHITKNTLKSKVFTLETREDVLLTILGIHNSVRKRQQKKDYDYEDVMSYHYNDMIWGATSNQQIIQYALVSIIIFCFLRKIR